MILIITLNHQPKAPEKRFCSASQFSMCLASGQSSIISCSSRLPNPKHATLPLEIDVSTCGHVAFLSTHWRIAGIQITSSRLPTLILLFSLLPSIVVSESLWLMWKTPASNPIASSCYRETFYLTVWRFAGSLEVDRINFQQTCVNQSTS